MEGSALLNPPLGSKSQIRQKNFLNSLLVSYRLVMSPKLKESRQNLEGDRTNLKECTGQKRMINSIKQSNVCLFFVCFFHQEDLLVSFRIFFLNLCYLDMSAGQIAEDCH